jgi:RNA polymerase subunit RPABC4/transcription elongation factor Spt4
MRELEECPACGSEAVGETWEGYECFDCLFTWE